MWHLPLSLTGISWLQPQTRRDVLVAWRRRLKNSWALLGVDAIAYLGMHLEGEDLMDF